MLQILVFVFLGLGWTIIVGSVAFCIAQARMTQEESHRIQSFFAKNPALIQQYSSLSPFTLAQQTTPAIKPNKRHHQQLGGEDYKNMEMGITTDFEGFEEEEEEEEVPLPLPPPPPPQRKITIKQQQQQQQQQQQRPIQKKVIAHPVTNQRNALRV